MNFTPTKIFLDPEVKNTDVAKRILNKFPQVPVQEVTDRSQIKKPEQHTRAKKQLYLAKFRGQAIKTCQGMGDYVCCQYYTISLISDCHLECTYCILQDYLKDNPMMTVYCNVDDIFEEVERKVSKHPDRLFRIGTGELSDSMALDHITEFSKDYLRWVKRIPNILLELKTKTTNIQNLLNQEAHERMIVSWSLNPQKYIQKEEIKCASLMERLNAAQQVADHGYSIATHFDPLLYFDDWKEQYQTLIETVAQNVDAAKIAWISIGSLRFTPELKKISQERFPKSKIMTAEMFPSADGKTRYFRPLREEMYKYVSHLVKTHLNQAPQYLCMETKAVWNQVYGDIPSTNSELEAFLSKKFRDTNMLAPEDHMNLAEKSFNV